MCDFSVRKADILNTPSDLLLLKHAQGFYGADRAVAERLISAELCAEAHIHVAPGKFFSTMTEGTISPTCVLFVGTPPLSDFTYREMQSFATRAVEIIATMRLPARFVTTTVHGTGFGLDGGEALQRLVRGFSEGLAKYPSAGIEHIAFLTLEERAERILAAALQACKAGPELVARPVQIGRRGSSVPQETESSRDPATGVSVGDVAVPDSKTVAKGRVFVAMPFSEEFDNVYEFGIYPAVRNCGLICERVDKAHFIGDVLARIRKGIETADIVIADLSESRPNVYLEVGYAWGKGRPVILIAKKGQVVEFDVKSHRCIFYTKFGDLAKEIEKLIDVIRAGRDCL
jgi:hypothetical protein